MGREKRHIIKDGGASTHPSEVLIRSNNLAEWRNPTNGAVIQPVYEGQDNVVRLGYDPATGGTVQTCELHTKAEVGPTASGSCTASRLNCATSPSVSQNEALESDTTDTSPVTTLSRFSGNGHSNLDGLSKPSDVHTLFGIWFEYDSENPGDVGGIPRSGVFHSGIGGGDVIIIEDLVNGGGWFNFTRFNQFQNYSVSNPLPQSSTWCDVSTNQHVYWWVMTTSYKPTFRVSVAPPGYARDPDVNPPTFFFPPNGLRYYVHAQTISGCVGFENVPLIPSTTQAQPELPRIQKLNRHIPRG